MLTNCGVKNDVVAVPADGSTPTETSETTVAAAPTLVLKKKTVTGTLNKELYEYLLKDKELSDKLENSASSQTEMNDISKQIFDLWDKELNIIWKKLNEAMTSDADKKALKAEELQWIKDKEKAIKDARKEFSDGSIAILIGNQKGAELTKERTIYLADKLGKLTNDPVNTRMNLYDYSYTMSYDSSNLNISITNESTCNVDIDLFRLTTFDGVGTVEGDHLTFKSNDMENGIEAIIYLNDNTAKVEVTKSNFGYVEVGQTWEFDVNNN